MSALRRPKPCDGSIRRQRFRRFCSRLLCPTRSKRRITFAPTISVTEYSRCLGGGGGVPGDGTVVPLGLGKKIRTLRAPLATEKSGKRKLDEDAPWVPQPQRARILKAAMGIVRYQHQSEGHRRELAQLQAVRQQTAACEQDWFPLCTSLEEARLRALQFSREVFEGAVAEAMRKQQETILSKNGCENHPRPPLSTNYINIFGATAPGSVHLVDAPVGPSGAVSPKESRRTRAAGG